MSGNRTLRRWRVQVQFVPQDCWIGVYWKHQDLATFRPPQRLTTVFICVVPCFPLVVMHRHKETETS